MAFATDTVQTVEPFASLEIRRVAAGIQLRVVSSQTDRSYAERVGPTVTIVGVDAEHLHRILGDVLSPLTPAVTAENKEA